MYPLEASVNGRILIWGLIAAGGLFALTILARPGEPRPQQTSRVDLFPAKTNIESTSAETALEVPRPTRKVRVARAAAPLAPAKDAAPVEPSDVPVTVQMDNSKNAPIPKDSAKPKKEPKPKPLEREALAYVGADPVAEAIWLDAINSTAVSAEARSDLIEDLNEDGFADPKNLTRDDLPLILSRLDLIEREAPYAMDDVNADAFAEAYKDLVNMYAKVTGR